MNLSLHKVSNHYDNTKGIVHNKLDNPVPWNFSVLWHYIAMEKLVSFMKMHPLGYNPNEVCENKCINV